MKQRLEQSGDEHRITDVVHVKLVEAQHPAIVEQFIERARKRVGAFTMTEHALMQASEKLVEVQPLFLLDRQCLEKTVEQPAFAATDGAMQIQAGQCLGRGAVQGRGLLCHAVDHPLLTMAEGVTLGVCLVPEVVMHHAGRRALAGRDARYPGEEASQ
ncbi:Glycerol-3-phosphate responsive antiterminator [compost metagenome]